MTNKLISTETCLAQASLAIAAGDLARAFAWYIDMPEHVRTTYRANLTNEQRQWLDATWSRWSDNELAN